MTISRHFPQSQHTQYADSHEPLLLTDAILKGARNLSLWKL